MRLGVSPRPHSDGALAHLRVPRSVALVAVMTGVAFVAGLTVVSGTASASAPAAGQLAIIAGNGNYGSPSPGPATSTPVSNPSAVAADSAGDVFIAASGQRIYEVTPSGTLSYVAGNGSYGAPTPGPATSSDLFSPQGLAVDSAGDLYISDTGSNRILKVTPSGTLSVIAGNGGSGAPTPGPATSSELQQPEGIAVGSAGDVFIADTYNGDVEKVTPSGTLSIVAGTGSFGAPTAGPAASSRLYAPRGVAVDSAGNLYIADSGNEVVEKVSPSGTLSVFAGTGSIGSPAPGPATSSGLWLPYEVAVDSTNDVYIADSQHDDIDKVTPSGTLSIVAGTGSYNTPTAGPATSSALAVPVGVTVDGAGDLFIADSDNNDVEEVGAPLVAPVLIADTPGTTAALGTSYSYTFTATGNPSPTFSVSSGSLPPGLTLHATTGVLSGAPTASGTFTFTVSATNSSMSVSSGSIVMTVPALASNPTNSNPTPTPTTGQTPVTPTPPLSSPPASSGGNVASTPSGTGYWTVSATGSLSAHGTATNLGSESDAKLAAPIIGVTSTTTGDGYWEVGVDGGVFSFGDAVFRGSAAGMHLAAPIVGIMRTPDGDGYWLVARDGGVFAFGNAGFYGSLAGKQLDAPITGMAATGDGRGYWLSAADGGVFAFGDATYDGSMGGRHLNARIVAISPTSDGEGYWLVGADGGVFTFGDASFDGSLGAAGTPVPVIAIITDGTTSYRLLTSAGTVYSYGETS